MLGLGEAGSAIAADLKRAGLTVRGWDPAIPPERAPIPMARNSREAISGAQVILSANSAAAAIPLAEEVAPALEDGQLYADLNTGTAALKERLSAIVTPSGALFADVALVAPVPGTGLKTPALASGPGAARFVEIFRSLGMKVDLVEGPPGTAAMRKLLRSVYMKGFACAIAEGMIAAQRFGCLDWFTEDLLGTLAEADFAFVRRLVIGTRRHAKRRTAEMQAAAELLLSRGIQPRISTACAEWLHEIAEHPEALPVPSILEGGTAPDGKGE